MAMNPCDHDFYSSRPGRPEDRAPDAKTNARPQPVYLVTPVDKGEEEGPEPEFMAIPVDRSYTAERGQVSMELWWASFRNSGASQIYLVEPSLAFLKLPLAPRPGTLAGRLSRLAQRLDMGEFVLIPAEPGQLAGLALALEGEPVCMLCASHPGYLFYEGYTGGVRCLAGPISLVELNRALKAVPP